MVIFSAVWVSADECGAQWVWRLPGGYAAGLPSFSSPRKCGLRGNLLCSVLGRGGWVPREGNHWEDIELDRKPHPPAAQDLSTDYTVLLLPQDLCTCRPFCWKPPPSLDKALCIMQVSL